MLQAMYGIQDFFVSRLASGKMKKSDIGIRMNARGIICRDS